MSTLVSVRYDTGVNENSDGLEECVGETFLHFMSDGNSTKEFIPVRFPLQSYAARAFGMEVEETADKLYLEGTLLDKSSLTVIHDKVPIALYTKEKITKDTALSSILSVKDESYFCATNRKLITSILKVLAREFPLCYSWKSEWGSSSTGILLAQMNIYNLSALIPVFDKHITRGLVIELLGRKVRKTRLPNKSLFTSPYYRSKVLLLANVAEGVEEFDGEDFPHISGKKTASGSTINNVLQRCVSISSIKSKKSEDSQ